MNKKNRCIIFFSTIFVIFIMISSATAVNINQTKNKIDITDRPEMEKENKERIKELFPLTPGLNCKPYLIAAILTIWFPPLSFVFLNMWIICHLILSGEGNCPICNT